MNLLVPNIVLPPATPEELEKIYLIEDRIKQIPQIEFATEHILHGGMYCRTIRYGPGIISTGALTKRATLVIVSGDVAMLAGDKWIRMNGYNVLPGFAGRKQVVLTISDAVFTMIFPTEAKTVEEAEMEFTDEFEDLMSRTRDNDIVITGVPAWQDR